MRFGQARIETAGQKHVFEVQVFLDEIDPDTVRLELYADANSNGPVVREEMTRGRPLVGSVRGYVYSASVPATRSVTDYTPRAIPCYPGVAVPLEANHILWQK